MDKKQFLFIKPAHFSFGLASIASFLASRGYEVRAIAPETPFFMKRLSSVLDEKRCMAVGVTAMTPNIDFAIRVSKQIKQWYPAIPLVIGGNHASALPERTLKESAFDIAVVGEGEWTILEVLKKLEEKVYPTLVAGTVEKCPDGAIIRNHARELIPDLSVLSPPDYSLFDLEPGPGIRNKNISTSRGIAFLASRGCPYNCIYCASDVIWGRKLRFRKAEKTIDDIEALVVKHGLDSISLLDDELLSTKEYLTVFCRELVRRGLHRNIVWECQGRVNSVDDAVLEMMKDAGCKLIRFGLESGSDRILRSLKNGTVSIHDSYRAIELCNKHQIACFGSFMIGSPDETSDDVIETINLIENSGLASAACYALVPYPGTALYRQCIGENLLSEDTPWSSFLLENYRGENIPRYVIRNRHYSSTQLYHMARYVHHHIVSRLNYGLPREKTDHRMNLDRILAGETKLSSPGIEVSILHHTNNIRYFYKRLATHPHKSRFVYSNVSKRLLRRI